jgi:microcystin-dependent protein
MSEPFLAEIRIFGFNFAPRGWALCDGQILPINQNQSLFSLLGTTYGGDGRTSFGLPDLRGRAPLHSDSGHPLGQKTGEEAHALGVGGLPSHTHDAQATSASANSTDGTGRLLGDTTGARFAITPYDGGTQSSQTLTPGSITSAASQRHDNMQPYLAINFCIALQGLFPSRN